MTLFCLLFGCVFGYGNLPVFEVAYVVLIDEISYRFSAWVVFGWLDLLWVVGVALGLCLWVVSILLSLFCSLGIV